MRYSRQANEVNRLRAEVLTDCPVIRWDSLEARKETSAAMSVGAPTYPTAAVFESCSGILNRTDTKQGGMESHIPVPRVFLEGNRWWSRGHPLTRVKTECIVGGSGRNIHIGVLTGPGA